MANLHKFSVQESLNTDTAGTWDTGSTTAVSSTTLNTIHGSAGKDISGYHTIGITITADIYISFLGSSTADALDSSDLILPAGTHFIKIPHGVNSGSGVYFNMERVSSDSTASIVLI